MTSYKAVVSWAALEDVNALGVSVDPDQLASGTRSEANAVTAISAVDIVQYFLVSIRMILVIYGPMALRANSVQPIEVAAVDELISSISEAEAVTTRV